MKLKKLENDLQQIYQEILNGEDSATKIATKVSEEYQESVKNLFRYLILRNHDLRKIHDRLSSIGVSSLRSSEGYVYSNVVNALNNVRMLNKKDTLTDKMTGSLGYEESKKLLRKHANTLFNRKRKKHFTEIMVTMPDEAATNVKLLKELILNGMEIARINLSHGDKAQWKKMISNLKAASKAVNKPIKIYIDLSGPKIRTTEIKTTNKKGILKDFIKIKEGEQLIITNRLTNGKRAKYGKANELLSPGELGVSLPQIIDDIKIGDRVFFDDGMVEAKVISKNKKDAHLTIIRAHKNKIKSRKGINLPDTKLNLPSLTERDISLLPFVVKNADIIGYSFVQNVKDVRRLYERLAKLGDTKKGIVFKIETKEAFNNLPLILLEAMKRKKIGVMIARGDLAVEIGFERISEVQQQILWICEAAHVPVIWATQVLENMAKTGIATRAEISDAAISAQAECVMLNKGPFIVDAVKILNNILIKMEAHSFKKKNTLRPLNVAKRSLKNLTSLNGTNKG